MKKEFEEKGQRVCAIVEGALAALQAEGMTRDGASTYLIIRGASALQDASNTDAVREVIRNIDINLVDVFDSDDDDDEEETPSNIIKLRQ